MNQIVKDFMVTLSDYATTYRGSTLYEAVLALETAKSDAIKDVDQAVHPHWVVLVLDENEEVIGKLSQLNLLMALEPKTDYTALVDRLDKFGFSSKFVASIRESSLNNEFVDNYLYPDNLAMEMKVDDFMKTLSENEFIDENTTLNSAAHQFSIRKRLSLLVTRKDKVVGVLRLADVFSALITAMKKAHNSEGEPI